MTEPRDGDHGAAGARHDVPWLAEVQRPPHLPAADALRLAALLANEHGTEITTLPAWRTRRAAIRRWWVDFLGPLATADRPPPRLQVLGEDRPGEVVRQLVRYVVEPGLTTDAYLLRPAWASGQRPGVAVFHQTVAGSIREPAGVEGPGELAFGLECARRGCVALCPRNFLWTDNHTLALETELQRFQARHPASRGMAQMLYAAMLAIDVLASSPEVDARRIGAVGHSLGGKEVLYLAALDDRVQAAVSSEGGIGVRFSNWYDPWYLGGEILRDGFDHEHHELLALAAPRPFLLIGGGGADGPRSWPFIQAVLPVFRLYGGTPRVGLLNHGQGHSVPPEAATRLYEWLEAYL
ncbi:MAG: dienelactone hydrolase family protein [Candidatus Latescibacterota bacterium]